MGGKKQPVMLATADATGADCKRTAFLIELVTCIMLRITGIVTIIISNIHRYALRAQEGHKI